jgi:hypothetical protein
MIQIERPTNRTINIKKIDNELDRIETYNIKKITWQQK